MFLDDIHFSGINKLEEMIKDEIIQRKITPHIQLNQEESYQNYDYNNVLGAFSIEKETEQVSKEEIKSIKEKTEEIKDDIEEEKVIESLAKPSLSSRFFNRLYFSFVTATTIGYGDVVPYSNACKLITIVQLTTSIALFIL
tara:strand:- start:1562 stop:1984 length:423 start_codon:yes stop_codon:yes gene_type:complete